MDERSSLREALRALTYSEARLLVVDDDRAVVMFLEGLLSRAGYTNLLSTTDSREVLPLFEENCPDLVLMDLEMPFLDGFAVLEQLRSVVPATEYLPVLVLTGSESPEAKWRALFRGAKDFLRKPFDPLELLLRLHRLLGARFLHAKLNDANRDLHTQFRERTNQLLESQGDTIERLAQVVEFHDDATGQHTRRVGEMSARIGDALGLPPSQVDLLRRAAPLHDVGKIGIPDSILLKPERLTPEEFEVMKMHTSIGARILSGGQSDYLAMAEVIALGHHERWDGSGYPQGLPREEIPLPARIVALADFHDALSNDRPYRPAWTRQAVLIEIDRQTGRHFDPAVTEAFLRVQTDDFEGPPTSN